MVTQEVDDIIGLASLDKPEIGLMSEKFQQALHREEALGMNPNEAAFYNALAENDCARDGG